MTGIFMMKNKNTLAIKYPFDVVKDFVMLGAKPQDMTALSIDYVIKI